MINVELSTDYKTYVEKAFNDISFMNMYNSIFNTDTKESCIENELNIYNLMNNIQFYTIYDDTKFAAYFASEDSSEIKYLTTFFIDKEYRNKEFYKCFLDNLRDKLGNIFCAYRDNGNEKAENFLKKLGGQLIMNTENKRLYLFKRSV